MTRCVADCVQVDAVLAGAPLAVPPRPAAGLRLALPGTLLLDALEPAVARAFERALQRLVAAGARIVERPLAELAEIAAINAPGGFSSGRGLRRAPRGAAHAARTLRPARGGAPRARRGRQRGRLHRDAAAPPRLDRPRRRGSWRASTPSSARRCRSRRRRSPTWWPATRPSSAPTACCCATPSSPISSTAAPSRCPATRAGELPVGLMLTAPGGHDAALAAVALAVEAALAA